MTSSQLVTPETNNPLTDVTLQVRWQDHPEYVQIAWNNEKQAWWMTAHNLMDGKLVEDFSKASEKPPFYYLLDAVVEVANLGHHEPLNNITPPCVGGALQDMSVLVKWKHEETKEYVRIDWDKKKLFWRLTFRDVATREVTADYMAGMTHEDEDDFYYLLHAVEVAVDMWTDEDGTLMDMPPHPQFPDNIKNYKK